MNAPLPSTPDLPPQLLPAGLAPVFISPTQLGVWKLCPRKWAFQWVEGDKPEQTEAMALGTEVHLHLENWVDHGIVPPDTKSGRLAKAMLDKLPPPKSPGVATEFKFDLPSPLPNVFFVGRIDRLDEGFIFKLTDYKTTSSLQWQKQSSELAFDPQALIYAAWFFVSMPTEDVVHLEWLYVTTKGKTQCVSTPVELTRDEVDMRMMSIVEDARHMADIKRSNRRALEVVNNPRSCEAFGGCPFVDKCGVTPVERMLAVMAESDLITRLRAEKAAQEAKAGAVPGGAPAPSQLPPPLQVPAAAQLPGLPHHGGVLSIGVVPPDAAPQAASIAPPGQQLSLEARLAAAAPPQALPAALPLAQPVAQLPVAAALPVLPQALPVNAPPLPQPSASTNPFVLPQPVPTPQQAALATLPTAALPPALPQQPIAPPQRAIPATVTVASAWTLPTQPAPTPSPVSTPPPAVSKGSIGLLLIDCLAEKQGGAAQMATPFADIVAPLEKLVAQYVGQPNWRMGNVYVTAQGALIAAIEDHLDSHNYDAISVDSFAPSYKIAADALKARSAVVIRGL